MKNYTDIEQSKKLAEILPLESADMSWYKETKMFPFELHTLPYSKHFVRNDVDDELLPCWSLAALLQIIPKDIEGLNRLRIDIDNVDFSIWYDDLKGYGVNDKLPDITLKEPVDACYEMVLKLHESKLL